MFQIDDTLVSLDVVERCFLCDIFPYRGQALRAKLEEELAAGDIAAIIYSNPNNPAWISLEEEELPKLQAVLPLIWDDLSPAAQAIIQKQGVAYIDEEGDLVTSIVHGKDCVFTCYDADGVCKCAIEKAYREGKSDFYKPISCHLYPIRITQYRDFRRLITIVGPFVRRRSC